MRRSRDDIEAALLRLAGEQCFPLVEFRSMLCKSRDTLTRWVIHGRHGVYLDGMHTPDRGWVTSVEGVRRLLRAWVETHGPGDLPTPPHAPAAA